MPEYLSPGVYVEEVSSGVKPIEGVGTSTGAFVGIAERGPIRKPVLCTNWAQFTKTFGGFIQNAYLAYAVYQFFNEGGTKCFVVRAAKGDPLGKLGDPTAVPPVLPVPPSLKKAEVKSSDLTVKANSEGKWGNALSVVVSAETILIGEKTARAGYFKLAVSYKGKEVESFDHLTLDETKPGHVAKKVVSDYIEVVDSGATTPVFNTVATASYPLIGGDSVETFLPPDWAGADGFLFAFDTVDEINIVAIPDAQGHPVVTQDGYTYCQNRGDCFFVADTLKGLEPVDAGKFRKGILKDVNESAFNSSFGALYYPWIQVSDPLTGGTKLTPPSGAIVGTYSHTDVKRGVHKAPAGITEGYLNSASGVEKFITKGEHDILNPMGVNVIRSFPGLGNVVWGSRTLSADSEWKYVNVRRLFLMVEESIDEGTQWVVFEPNTPILWGQVKRNLTAFLTRVWRDGALFGTTAEEAFFVKVDAENNPPAVVDAGQLIIEVGIAPVKPAEFVIIRISQKVLAAA
jgi:phage tail sheath protein FI